MPKETDLISSPKDLIPQDREHVTVLWRCRHCTMSGTRLEKWDEDYTRVIYNALQDCSDKHGLIALASFDISKPQGPWIVEIRHVQ